MIEEYEDESEETEVNKQELIEKWEMAIESAEFYGKGGEERLISYMKEFASDLKQLYEPEVTLDKAFEKVAESYLMTKEEICRHLDMLEDQGGEDTCGKTEVEKDLDWAKDELFETAWEENKSEYLIDLADVYKIIDQLDEPEVLSQEITEEQAYNKIAESFPATAKEIKSVLEKYYSGMFFESSEELQESITRVFDVEEKSKTIEALTGMTLEQIAEEAINGGIVPKQEEVDRAYKDGYEKGKQHTFYKGYLEGITDKGSEPETVADVVTTFWKSYERLKEVMGIEVEELE